MSRILIVEDDEIVRKNVVESIPWEENGHKIVGVASNGMQAYDKFNYAREAIRLRAYEYILKDSGEAEILRVVNRVAEEIHAQSGNVHLTQAGERILLSNCLFKLLQEDTAEEEKESICKKLDIGFEGWQYQVMLAGMKKEYQPDLFKILEVLVMKWEESLQQYMITVGLGRVCSEKSKFSVSFDDAVFAVNDDSQGKIRFYKEMNQTKFIRQIREYILENYADPELSLNKLSEQVYLTPTYVSSLFKRYMNSNFKEYLINLRMREACNLLKNTELKTYEVSERVGYPNPQYFSVLFKKYTGETPTGYHNHFFDGKE